MHDGGQNSSANNLLCIEPVFFEECDEGDGLVNSLTFEAFMGYGGDDMFPPLDMLDHNDTSETGGSAILSLTHGTPGGFYWIDRPPSLTCHNPGGSIRSADPLSLTHVTPGGSSRSTGTPLSTQVRSSGSSDSSSGDKLR